jgi:DtxR family Mn-dependent transcriptional regulator
MMPTSTVEDYLKCILVEEQQSGGALVGMGRIATALDVAPGTVTAMVKTLAASGLIGYEPYSGVRLTEAGLKLAVHVLRRHRLIEQFLVEVMGMDWSAVHSEAERLEHVVSDALIDRMDEMLGHPSVDPHGDPIPDPSGAVEEQELVSLLSCPEGTGLEVSRVADQTPDYLRFLERQGIRPGVGLEVTLRNEAADTVELRVGDGRTLNLGFRAASKILVAEAVPSLVD